MNNKHMASIQRTVAPLQAAIAAHPLITQLTTLEALHRLMSQHVFAVWDFINLVKTLYSRLSSTQPPWFPPQDPDAVRLLLEIILEEETDQRPALLKTATSSSHCSHFTLYQEAMVECGASTQAIDHCLAALKNGQALAEALNHPAILPSTRRFVRHTFNTCREAPLPSLAANFVLGREAMVPRFFTPWLEKLIEYNLPNTKILRYYLSHHIELDGHDHFPKAARMLSTLCGEDDTSWAQARQGAQEALQARLDFLSHI